MRGHSLLFTSFFLYAASFASASSITYEVSVNTSTISGASGSLDFQFDSGPLVTQAASLQILNFTSDGTVVPPSFPTGDVAGAPPATLTLDNGSRFSDYFEDFNFGTSLAFNVSLYGPALSSPDGISTSGSTFAFSMFSDAEGTIPALTSDTIDGFAFTVDVNLDGTTTLNNVSSQTSVVPATGAPIPEPGSITLVGSSLVFVVLLRRKRQQMGLLETGINFTCIKRLRRAF